MKDGRVRIPGILKKPSVSVLSSSHTKKRDESTPLHKNEIYYTASLRSCSLVNVTLLLLHIRTLKL